MGTQHSQPNQGLVEDARFGLIKILNNTNKRTKSTDTDSEEDLIILMETHLMEERFEEWQKKLVHFEHLKDWLFLPTKNKMISKSYCGTNCTIESEFPMFRILLRDEILDRSKIYQPYSEAEMWYFLYELVLLGKKFEEKKEKIGNVHTKNIVMNERGLVKVIGTISLPKEVDNFTQICCSQLSDVFLAPQQIQYECFGRYKYPPKVDCNKAELFSMGITMLEIGTLQLSTYLYDRGPYKLNFKKMKANLNTLKSIYSSEFCLVVQNWLQENPVKRRNCGQIYNQLKPYENQIFNMQFDYSLKENSFRMSEMNNSFLNINGSFLNVNGSFLNPKNFFQTKIIKDDHNDDDGQRVKIYYPLESEKKHQRTVPNIQKTLTQTSSSKAQSEANLHQYDDRYCTNNILHRHN